LNQYNTTKQMGVNPNYVVGVVSNTSGDGVLKMVTPTENFTTTSTYDDAVALLSVCVSGGGGGGGSLTSTYVGFGNGLNTLAGEAAFTYAAESNRLAVDTVKTKRISSKSGQLEILNDTKLNAYPNTRNDAGSPVNVLTTSETGIMESHPVSDLFAAQNGLSKSSGFVELGQAVGAIGNPAILNSNREIPLNGYNVAFSGGSGKVIVGNTAATDKFHVEGSARITDKIGVGITVPSNGIAHFGGEMVNGVNADFMYMEARATASTSGTWDMYGSSVQITKQTIPAGVVDNGVRMAITGDAYSALPGFAGTLDRMIGVRGRAGIAVSASTAVVNNAYGGYFEIRNETPGTTIGNAYGVFINNSDFSGGTITNRYDLYASSTLAKNYFGGPVGFGKENATARIHARGAGSSVSDETIIRLDQNGENGSVIEFNNAFGPLVKINGTKKAGGADADDGKFVVQLATNSSLSDELIVTKTGTQIVALSGSGRRFLDADANGVVGIAPTQPVTSLAAVGSTPNANAATITGSTLNLEPASATHKGVISLTQLKFPLKMTVVDGNTDVPGAGMQKNEVIRIPAAYNGYSISDVSYGVRTTGATGTMECQIRKNGSGTAGVTFAAGQGVEDVTLTGLTVATGDIIDVEIISNSMATPQQGLWVTIFLTPN